CAYLSATRDRSGFTAWLRQPCLDIVEAYRSGTDLNIRVDPGDGLVIAGDVGTQLTWMDAKRDGVVFTPRHGKPVEISALWYSGLLELAAALEKDTPRTARELRQTADLTARHFEASFWNEQESCLFDCLAPGATRLEWTPLADVRPNQIL